MPQQVQTSRLMRSLLFSGAAGPFPGRPQDNVENFFLYFSTPFIVYLFIYHPRLLYAGKRNTFVFQATERERSKKD